MSSPFSLHLRWHVDLDIVVVAHAHGGTVHGEMSEMLWVGSEC